MVRQVLESAAYNLVPEDERAEPHNLGHNLKVLERQEFLKEPIMEAAKAVMIGGHNGSHWKPDMQPDSTHAQALMDLMGSLMEYLYVAREETKNSRRKFIEMVEVSKKE